MNGAAHRIREILNRPPPNCCVTYFAACTASICQADRELRKLYMKDTKPKPETPPLTRAGRKIADATLAAAKFTPTADGKAAIRKFEVHGMVVTERVSAEATPGVHL